MATIPGLQPDGTLIFASLETEADRIAACETIGLLFVAERPLYGYMDGTKRIVNEALESLAYRSGPVPLEDVCRAIERYHGYSQLGKLLRESATNQAEILRTPYLLRAHPRVKEFYNYDRRIDPPECQSRRAVAGPATIVLAAAFVGSLFTQIPWLIVACLVAVCIAASVLSSSQPKSDPRTETYPVTPEQYAASKKKSAEVYAWLQGLIAQIQALQLPPAGNFSASPYEGKVDPTGGWPVIAFRISASRGTVVHRDVEVRLQYLGPDQHIQGAEAVARATSMITAAAEEAVAELKRDVAVVC